MKSINNSLRDQLRAALKTGKVKVKYPEGYKQWKQKFDYFYGVTKDVNHTLDAIYGPNGSVDNYKGSVVANSDFKVPQKKHTHKKHQHNHKPKPKDSGALKHFKKD